MPRYNSRSGKEQHCQNVAEGTPSTYLEWAKQQGQRKKAINTKRKAANQTLLKSDSAGYLVNPDKNKKGKLPASYRKKAEEARKIGAESQDPKIKALAEETAKKAEAVAEKAEQLTAPTPPAPKRRGRKPKSTEPAPVAESTPKPRRSRKPKATEPEPTPVPKKDKRLPDSVNILKMQNTPVALGTADLKSITSSIPLSEFDPDKVEAIANAIENTGTTNTTRPIILKQTGAESFEVVDGHLLYHAAIAASAKNPRNEMINALIIDKDNRSALEQIEFLNKKTKANTSHLPRPTISPFPFNETRGVSARPLFFGKLDINQQAITSNEQALFPTVPKTSFSEKDIDFLADLIVKTGGLLRPITIQGSNSSNKSGPKFDIVDGNLEYYAALKAREKDPRTFEQIQVSIIQNAQPTMMDQVDTFRSVLGTTDPAPEKRDYMSERNAEYNSKSERERRAQEKKAERAKERAKRRRQLTQKPRTAPLIPENREQNQPTQGNTPPSENKTNTSPQSRHKPLMTEDEAIAYTQDSVWKDRIFFHGTTKSGANAITSKGVDPLKTGNALYGMGFYVGGTSINRTGLEIATKYANKKQDSTTLEMRLNIKNPRIFSNALSFHPLMDELVQKGEIPAIKKNDEGEYAGEYDTKEYAQGVMNYFQRQGYDALYFTDLDYAVIFSAESVAIYNAFDTKSPPQSTIDKVNDEQQKLKDTSKARKEALINEMNKARQAKAQKPKKR